MKLVFYSLSIAGNSSDKQRIYQLTTSIQSLRNYNLTVRVQLHLLGELPEEATHALKILDVHIIQFDSYANLIERHLPGCGQWLSHYPVMHKFLTMEVLRQFEPSQVLYLDSDTYIHTDIEHLFNRYCLEDIYAREEPGSRQSPMGYHPEYLDEDLLSALQTQLNCKLIKPFNTGVLLMNNNVWQKLLQFANEYLKYIAGFSLWMESKGVRNNSGPDIRYLNQNKTIMHDALSTIVPLTFPSSNFWIKEQVALWLTAGKLSAISVEFIELNSVLQGCEELRAPGKYMRPIISHYYSQNTRTFLETIISPVHCRTLYKNS